MVEHQKQDTYNKIVTVISQILTIEKNTISPESSLEELGADSLDMLEIIMKIEESFNVEISDDAAEKIVTVHDAVNTIETLKNK